MDALPTDPRLLTSYLYWLTDEDISESLPFPGWQPCWNKPDGKSVLWAVEDREKNAYHCRRLGEAMREAGGWIGEPVEYRLENDHKLHGGNHRVRAAQWLWRTAGVLVLVPLRVVG